MAELTAQKLDRLRLGVRNWGTKLAHAILWVAYAPLWIPMLVPVFLFACISTILNTPISKWERRPIWKWDNF